MLTVYIKSFNIFDAYGACRYRHLPSKCTYLKSTEKNLSKKEHFFCFSKHFKTFTINHICTKIIIKTAKLWKIVCFFFGLLFRLTFYYIKHNINFIWIYTIRISMEPKRLHCFFFFNIADFLFLFLCSYNCEMETGSKEPQKMSIQN